MYSKTGMPENSNPMQYNNYNNNSRSNSNVQPSAPPIELMNLPNATVVEPFEVMLVDVDGNETRSVVPAGFQYVYVNPSETGGNGPEGQYNYHCTNGGGSDNSYSSSTHRSSTEIAEMRGRIMVRDEHNAVVEASLGAARYQAALQYQIMLNNKRRDPKSGDLDLTVKDHTTAEAARQMAEMAANYQRIHIPKHYVSSNDYDPEAELRKYSARPVAPGSSAAGAAASSGGAAHNSGGYEPAPYECGNYEISEYKSIYD